MMRQHARRHKILFLSIIFCVFWSCDSIFCSWRNWIVWFFRFFFCNELFVTAIIWDFCNNHTCHFPRDWDSPIYFGKCNIDCFNMEESMYFSRKKIHNQNTYVAHIVNVVIKKKLFFWWYTQKKCTRFHFHTDSIERLTNPKKKYQEKKEFWIQSEWWNTCALRYGLKIRYITKKTRH